MFDIGNKSEYASEQVLKESISRIESKKAKERKIIWKSSRQILGNSVVILPKEIDYSNFNQGEIKDCYFISCVNALAQIPQLLHFIMGLTNKNIENENPSNFVVNFFIDGKWEKIFVEDSFPCFELPKKNALVGVNPNNNELFMMILEKTWAIINGGYDNIECGYNENIFELFLGCKCDSFYNNGTNYINVIKKIIDLVEENEKKIWNFIPM